MKAKNEELHYYRTGLFTVLGVCLLVVFIIVLSSSSVFHQPVYMESYFDESVQGLTEGSLVKYRGVGIGQVTTISFIGDQYHSDRIINDPSIARYVYVRMALKTVSFLGGGNLSTESKLADAVKSGLRVHLAPEGLTGNSYLELDFSEPNSHLLQIKWDPRYYYVPSRPSTLSTMSASLSSMFNDLKSVDFKEFFANLTSTARSARMSFDRISGLMVDQEHNIAIGLENFRHITDNLRLITENISTYPSGFIRTVPPKEGG